MERNDQPDESDDDKIHVLEVIGNPKPVLSFHRGLDVVGVGFPECSELLPRKYALFTTWLCRQLTAAGDWLLCLSLERQQRGWDARGSDSGERLPPHLLFGLYSERIRPLEV